jgi:tetratricopeptide (TPR) repeat protein
MMKNHLAFILLASVLHATVWSQVDPKAQFEAANAAYADGDYAAAIAGYESILAESMHFESEYNLGNAHYKLAQWGPAILHYERAALLSPSNADLKTNLTLANAQIKDRIESLPSNGILDIWERVTAPGRFQLWARLMVLAWTLGFGALAWRIWVVGIENRRLLGSSAAALLSIGLACMLLTQTTSKRIESSKSAIVMAVESAVRNEPGTNGMTLFMLHEGTKVTVIERNANHWKVQLANGNTGWIAAGDLTEI